ncbi:MAG: CoA-acylating methylmalonate-semialdehyde dehydrogenase [Coxiellaceae bacterium]|nr:CoA-acylating methylmalonate-semialdehyde dehydrogenase [Coxiellaceae bacterium]
MTEKIEHFINGKVVAGTGKDTLEVHNPATGKVVATVAMASEGDVKQAVTDAKAAFETWSAQTPLKRSRVLFKFKALLEDNMDALAAKLSEEHGKVFADAKGEVMRGIEVVEFICGAPALMRGTFSEDVAGGMDCYTVRQALGVCGGVTPFNFPIMISIWQSTAAIATGNTFVLKPSEKDPSTPMMLAELWNQAGLPAGVFNVVNGDKSAVDVLLNHPDVETMVCVGSTPVAEYIYKTAIQNNKRAQAFGGAKNHAILMPDADLDLAVNCIYGAAFGAAGERCMALPVVVAVGDEVADALVEKLKPMLKNMKVGPWDQADVEMGPLITAEHRERVLSYVELGKKEGATLAYDGSELTVAGHEGGYFMGPCIFDNVKSDMRIYKEEIFGPVLCVVRVNDFETALQLINDHEYGNGTAVFTCDGGTARAFAKRVQVGMVGINVPIPVPIAYHSFGGWKRSVFGDLRIHGGEALQFYTKAKSVTIKWPEGTMDESAMVMPAH